MLCLYELPLGISTCDLTHGSGLVDVVFVRITTWGTSACHLAHGSGLADVVFVWITAGYIRLPPDSRVRISRCCACTDYR